MHKPYRTLVVDADHSLRLLVQRYLEGHGFVVTGVASMAEARNAITQDTYDLALLDLGLPDGDGMELLREWRVAGTLPVICISGRTEEPDRVMALELGADDYVVKPFSQREVLARIRALMRRTASPSAALAPIARGRLPRAYRFANWTLNLGARRLTDENANQVPLTNSEFNILTVLLGSANRVVSREQIIKRTRAFDDVYDRAVDVQILRLRRKLEVDAKTPVLLCTERGAGYFLNTTIEAVW
jgi:two-component system, OmpR family, response regulator